jgi:capsule synthesis protein PGA_cap
VFLGTGGRGALASIAGSVSGAPGIVNLEGPVGDPAGVGEQPFRLLHAAAALAELRAAGVAVAGIANNHVRDAGEAGAAATMRALVAVGIQAAGGAAGPATIALGPVRVVVTAHDLEAGVPAALGAELAAARRRGDALIATFHVTGPASYLPRPELVGRSCDLNCRPWRA